LALGLSYLINAIIVKNAFTSGLLNKSISDRSVMFPMVKVIAYSSQVCLFQVSIPVIMAFIGDLNVLTTLTPIMSLIGSIIFVANIVLPFGMHCQKHDNKNAQIAYSYVIEGPANTNESIENIYKSLQLVSMNALTHYDTATRKYHQARDAVSKANIELRKVIDQYDDAWRRSIIHAQYMYEESMPCNTPQAVRLADAMINTNNEVKKFNIVVDSINAQEYIPRKKTSKPATNTQLKQHQVRTNQQSELTPQNVEETTIVDVIWNYEVNWY
jgi:hypothetical protein